MADDSSIRRFWRATVAFLLVASWSASAVRAQYTFVQDSDTSDTWDNTARWLDGGTNTTFPNAADATVSIAAPTTTAALSGPSGYTLQIPNDVTIGHLTIDNTGYENDYRTVFGNNAGHLRFQSTAGPATYTETFGSNTGTTSSQYRFFAAVDLLSDLVIDQDNYPGFNSGTIFSNVISGASNLTLTKTGQGGIQLEKNNPLPGVEIPFQGHVVIDQGDIRLLTNAAVMNVSGLTVNAGGQLKLGDNAPNATNTNWSLASGAVLTLNGSGKASGNNPEGALRFALGNFISSTSFDTPVVLESDSVISVSPNGGGVAFNTATISSVVSGPGGLTKGGPGTLILNHPEYDGDTTVLAGGPLRLDTATLTDAADVHLTSDSTDPQNILYGLLDLNFAGPNTMNALFFDGVPQADWHLGSHWLRCTRT